MSETILDKINSRSTYFNEILTSIEMNILITVPLMSDEYIRTEPYSIMFEFDTLVKEYPDTYRIYLNNTLKKYLIWRKWYAELTVPNEEIKSFVDTLLSRIELIITHLNGLLKPENGVLKTYRKYETPLSSYEKVRSRLIFFNETLEAVAFNNTSFTDEYLMDNGIDHLLITYEIDQLKNELPETDKKTLEHILLRYISLQERISEHIILNTEIPNTSFTLIFSMVVDTIVEHLKTIMIAKNEITPNNKEIPKGLKTNLLDTQMGKLYDLLVDGKFIPNSTNKQNFLWALGSEKQPEQWQTIQWNVAKQSLRELLTPIMGTITNQHIRDIKNLFLDMKGNPFEMYKSTTSKHEFSASYTDICSIIKSLNLD